MKQKQQNNDRETNRRQQELEQKMVLFNIEIEEKRKLLDKLKVEIKDISRLLPAREAKL